ncbi:hypothetical protein GF352_02410 [archaeon]|nr:hypothetical protein [archaeon]
MNRGFLIIGAFILAAIITWMLLLLIIGGNRCPRTLPEQHYVCVMDEDCYFHPKYNCINYEPLDCVLADDLSARQQAGDLIECLCVSNRCFTRVRQETGGEGVEIPTPDRTDINISIEGNVSDLFETI